MNKIKYLAYSLLLGLGLTGCNDMLDENVHPDKAHTNEVSQGMPVLVFYANQSVYDHAEYNVYLSQCLTTMGRSQTGSYAYKSGWQFLTMNRHPQWRRHFYDIGRNGNILIENASKINSPNAELVARVIMLMSMQLTTDAFGDMPRSEAYLSNAPAYDTQASIYKYMFEEIETLKKLFKDPEWTNNPLAYPITQKMDRIYAGDLTGWEGLLYAIEARLLLRNIPNVDRSPAMCQKIYDAAQRAIDTWRSGNLRYGSWFGNEPRYNFDGGTGEQNAVWSAAQPCINSWGVAQERTDRCSSVEVLRTGSARRDQPGCRDVSGLLGRAERLWLRPPSAPSLRAERRPDLCIERHKTCDAPLS